MNADIKREFRRLRNAMRELDTNVKKLSVINNSVVDFNTKFGGLMTAISLQQGCIEPRAPPSDPTPPISKIPVLKLASTSTTPEVKDSKPSKATKSLVKKPSKPTKPARTWNWPKGVRSKMPKKYQTPTEMEKVERVLMVLTDSLRGMSIGDLVKASHVTVIQCKEILQTLMKLEQIKRKREKEGFIYCRI
ncbi:hypothetical protein THRCLA_10052 [Thraustotheca clavata]|uniref:Uncharacterized protein n=1 Tax=Thraustotheca clavata TaxID=74557 RepID=A0A1V9YTA8_9STRA|nr:hypothetical protein THRCLA_10052 [Thraustotheca clavata]